VDVKWGRMRTRTRQSASARVGQEDDNGTMKRSVTVRSRDVRRKRKKVEGIVAEELLLLLFPGG